MGMDNSVVVSWREGQGESIRGLKDNGKNKILINQSDWIPDSEATSRGSQPPSFFFFFTSVHID